MAQMYGEYDLEERTFQYALAVRSCIAAQRWSRVQWRGVDQLLRASGSVAANYIEANNAVSKADFLHGIRISKKEACEARLWLRLLGASSADDKAKSELRSLDTETDELIRILATIHRNSVTED